MVNKSMLWETLKDTRHLAQEPIPPIPVAGDFLAEQLDTLRRRAAQCLHTPIPPLPYAAFRLYWETGDRQQFQASYFERRQRLLCLSLLCWLEPESGYLPALEEIIWAICAEPFWCVPAHFTDENMAPLPLEQYATQLDLFACETGFALTETLALNGNLLSPMVEKQLRLQVERRILAPFGDNGRLFRFEHMANNWSAVCGGAIGGAALLLMEAGPALTAVLYRALSCMDVYLDSFGADGVCVEGVDYWTYGFGFFVSFADLLLRRTGGAVDLFADKKVHAIAGSQQVFYLHGNRTVSFADGSETNHFRAGLGCYLQRRYPDVKLPALLYAMGVADDSCGRFCLSLRDFLWFDAHARFGLPEQGTVWLPDAEWFVSRRRRFVLAAKAGNNAESHNHNDCGSFLLLKEGAPMLCDLGAGMYDAKYFSDERYEVFVNASRSHNVAIVAGMEQSFGRAYAARHTEVDFGEEEDVFATSLERCYPAGKLISYRRELRNRHAAEAVVLTDRFAFSAPAEVCEVFVSHEPVRLEPGCALLSSGTVTSQLRYDDALFRAELLEQNYFDHNGVQRTAYQLHLKNRGPVTALEFTAIIR